MFERATATAKTAVWKFWISFGAFLYAVCNAVFVVATLPIALFCPAKRRSAAMSFCLRRLLHFMFITAASPLRFVGLSRVRGADLFRRKGAVFVCNHGTLLDPMYALALIPDAGVLLKKQVRENLAIWYLVKCFDFIEIGWASASDASVRAELSYVLERSKRLLAEGKNYLIFPEGSALEVGARWRVQEPCVQARVRARLRCSCDVRRCGFAVFFERPEGAFAAAHGVVYRRRNRRAETVRLPQRRRALRRRPAHDCKARGGNPRPKSLARRGAAGDNAPMILGKDEVKKYLPQREPFLFVDRWSRTSAGNPSNAGFFSTPNIRFSRDTSPTTRLCRGS